jgi:hypothetical protein
VLNVYELTGKLERELLPVIPEGYRAPIESSLFEGDPCMAIDDFLQMSLLAGIRLPDETLAVVEETVAAWFDPELTDRTRGWIAQHKDLNRRPAA